MEINGIDSGRHFDFGKTASEYAKYRDIYPDALYDKLRALGVAADATAWLDLGTGTGVLPRRLYNANARIVGADIATEQIAFARKEAAANGIDVTYIEAAAENTGLPDHAFDAITAAQCFFYFDREKMKEEIPRLLKRGGIFIKIFMDWTQDDPVAKASTDLIRSLNPAWNSSETALKDMADRLFPDMQTERAYFDLPFTRESWHGRMRACRGTLASMDDETYARWERRHVALLEAFPSRFTVRHALYLSVFRL